MSQKCTIHAINEKIRHLINHFNKDVLIVHVNYALSTMQGMQRRYNKISSLKSHSTTTTHVKWQTEGNRHSRF